MKTLMMFNGLRRPIRPSRFRRLHAHIVLLLFQGLRQFADRPSDLILERQTSLLPKVYDLLFLAFGEGDLKIACRIPQTC